MDLVGYVDLLTGLVDLTIDGLRGWTSGICGLSNRISGPCEIGGLSNGINGLVR